MKTLEKIELSNKEFLENHEIHCNENDMNDKQKASELLNFMEEEWDSKAIINALNPYLKDSDLAELYDEMVSDGIIG